MENDKQENTLKYAFNTTVKGIRYKSDAELRHNIKQAVDDYSCPNCNSKQSETIGFSPLQMSYDKYPKEDRDPAYVWEQRQKCCNCDTEFWYENGT